ncbi:nuclear transport factor 2 family protein [Desulfatibacillum aliphaticivorans]|uniref:SnoaL-like domain-containing protein n=1 Tax=Desulfatibacillum aliphaticivorans TaxID=218208 RepID=B8FA80_DESAL|nr:nuclear transport factor 2 family protein [Desulfatibacillum aliphaticivorans]ACL03176.1 conserved hypothetical protein [Desulfatibacillum aliphaticivorans]
MKAKGRHEILIEKYIAAYNAFDLESMESLLHPDVKFENIADGEVNASAKGLEEFMALARQGAALFSFRKQEILGMTQEEDRVDVKIAFSAVLKQDLPGGPKAGETLSLKGRTEFVFQDGKIRRITDIS